MRPDRQGTGLGRVLLDTVVTTLARRGYAQAVLHVLVDDRPAVRLYEDTGWRPIGAPFDHSLLHRPTQTYALLIAELGRALSAASEYPR